MTPPTGNSSLHNEHAAVRAAMAGDGVPAAAIAATDPAVLAWIHAQRSRIEAAEERCRVERERVERLQLDVIRLRGQRDALRQSLVRRNHEDPMLGHLSEHGLRAIPGDPLDRAPGVRELPDDRGH